MRERIINYMREFGSITTLSEYIRQIRLEYKVADEWVSTTNRYGEKVQYKRYWLEEVQDD